MKEGWRMVKLGEVCESRLGKTLNSLTDVGKPYNYLCSVNIQWDKIDLSVLKTTLFTNDEIEKYRIQKGDLLVCEGGEAGRSAIWENEEPILYQNALHRIRFKNGVMIPRFCLHYLRKIKNDGTIDKDFARGATIKHLVTKSLYSIPIPLPPLEEQHRIVSILDASFEKIDALKKNAEENLKNAKALFQQVLAQELKPKEGWVEKKLGEIADFVRGPFGGSLTKSIFKESGYAVYEQQHAIHHHVNIRYFIDENKFDEMKRFEVKPGDLIMSCSGTIGEVYIIPLDAPVGVINQALLKLSVSSQLDRCYFKSWLESPIFKEIILKYSKGAAIPNVPGVKILKDINIVLPPLEEQHRIVRTLDTLSEKCRRLEQVAQQTIRECDALKQSILRQAFSGEL